MNDIKLPHIDQLPPCSGSTDNWHNLRREQASRLTMTFLKIMQDTDTTTISVDPEQARVIYHALSYYARSS